MTVAVEVVNRSGVDVDADGVAALARRILGEEGVPDGDLGIQFVGPDEIRTLKHRHLGIDEATDVLAFPIDAKEPLPDGMPRQLGDVILCPEVVGEEWRAALVHGLLHLLGHDHGAAMERREQALS
jgi:probable rRNA maturation factor